MDIVPELIEKLYSKDNKFAYKALKMLESESNNANAVYQFFDIFVEMIEHKNSYVRTRGILLIAANAKWDTDNKINRIINSYLKHIVDEKPITARSCIKAVPSIAKYKPELIKCIREALLQADVTIYKDSMSALICKDISTSVKKLAD